MIKIKSSEITPESVYLSRRSFIKAFGTLVGGTLIAAACGGLEEEPAATLAGPTPEAVGADELGSTLTSFKDVTTYNNFYEFTTNKEGVAELSAGLGDVPLAGGVSEGMVRNPGMYDIDRFSKTVWRRKHILKSLCGLERLVGMVIPWLGFPLNKLLMACRANLPDAKYVRFTTLFRLRSRCLDTNPAPFAWPYVEGLRLDEAMHALAILATGLYGKPLPPQNGAPVRLVVPWKYGFKSIKSIVRIELVADQPVSLWMDRPQMSMAFMPTSIRRFITLAGLRPPNADWETGRRRTLSVSTVMRTKWRNCMRGWIWQLTFRAIQTSYHKGHNVH